MNKSNLPHINKKISFLYIEKARIHQDDKSIVIVKGNEITFVPIGQINALIIGNGVSITNEAIKNISETGCTTFFTGEDGSPIYAVGGSQPRRTTNLIMQMECYVDTKIHMKIARSMYEKRFKDIDMKRMSLEQMRSAEGRRMKQVYQSMSEKYGVEWSGRKYKVGEYDNTDIVNSALTLANYYFYDICYAIIYTIGFSPSVGFIHIGNSLSFVYDISDLYKAEVTIPVAFEIASENKKIDDLYSIVRRKLRDKIVETSFMKTIVDDIYDLFKDFKEKKLSEEVVLYDCGKFTTASKNYDDFK